MTFLSGSVSLPCKLLQTTPSIGRNFVILCKIRLHCVFASKDFSRLAYTEDYLPCVRILCLLMNESWRTARLAGIRCAKLTDKSPLPIFFGDFRQPAPLRDTCFIHLCR